MFFSNCFHNMPLAAFVILHSKTILHKIANMKRVVCLDLYVFFFRFTNSFKRSVDRWFGSCFTFFCISLLWLWWYWSPTHHCIWRKFCFATKITWNIKYWTLYRHSAPIYVYFVVLCCGRSVTRFRCRKPMLMLMHCISFTKKRRMNDKNEQKWTKTQICLLLLAKIMSLLMNT